MGKRDASQRWHHGLTCRKVPPCRAVGASAECPAGCTAPGEDQGKMGELGTLEALPPPCGASHHLVLRVAEQTKSVVFTVKYVVESQEFRQTGDTSEGDRTVRVTPSG